MTIDYSVKMTQYEPVPGYKLKVACSDGATGILDMPRYIDCGVFKPLKNPQAFDRVRLAFGILSWPGDIDIAVERVRSDTQIIQRSTHIRPDHHLNHTPIVGLEQFMSDDLEAWFSMLRKRKSSYDAEYTRTAVGSIRDGVGAKSFAHRLGVSKETTREWLLSYRTGGEAALTDEHEGNGKYDYETKSAVVFDHLERRMSKSGVMEHYGVASRTCLKRQCQNYRRGGPEALCPKLKSRSKGARSKPKPASTREQLLEEENTYLRARVAYLRKTRALLASKPAIGRSR